MRSSSVTTRLRPWSRPHSASFASTPSVPGTRSACTTTAAIATITTAAALANTCMNVLASAAAVVIVAIAAVVVQALRVPGTDGVEAKLAEWGRDHGLSRVVTLLERIQYY